MTGPATRTYAMTARAEGAEATHERIVRCALELFLEHWFDDVTLAAIARAAGVSHQTVLNHFGSKVGVLMAAAEVLGRDPRRSRPGETWATCRAPSASSSATTSSIGDANVRVGGHVRAATGSLVPAAGGRRGGSPAVAAGRVRTADSLARR